MQKSVGSVSPTGAYGQRVRAAQSLEDAPLGSQGKIVAQFSESGILPKGSSFKRYTEAGEL